MYDNVNTPKWNLEVEPFVVQCVVQKEKSTCVRVGKRSHGAFRCC